MRVAGSMRLDQRGFTLAELLVAIAIMGLVMLGLLTLLKTGNESYLTGSNQVEAQSAARVALERMSQEIRQAGVNPRGVTTFNPIVSAGACPNANAPTATALMIQSDGDGDGVIGGTECVLYQLNGTNLQRRDFSVDATPQTIIGGAQALTFTYFDVAGCQLGQGGCPALAAANVFSVQIAITTQPEIQPAIFQAGRVAVTMMDRVRLRNR